MCGGGWESTGAAGAAGAAGAVGVMGAGGARGAVWGCGVHVQQTLVPKCD